MSDRLLTPAVPERYELPWARASRRPFGRFDPRFQPTFASQPRRGGSPIVNLLLFLATLSLICRMYLALW